MSSQIKILNILEKKFENKLLLTRDDIANILDVSVGTVTNLIKYDKIPYVKLGDAKTSTIRFDITAIADWIENQKYVKESV